MQKLSNFANPPRRVSTTMGRRVSHGAPGVFMIHDDNDDNDPEPLLGCSFVAGDGAMLSMLSELPMGPGPMGPRVQPCEPGPVPGPRSPLTPTLGPGSRPIKSS